MSKDTSSYRQILKATSIFGGVQVFKIITTLIRSKLIAILLGPTGMGIAGLLTSTTSLIGSLTNLGLRTAAVKDVAKANGSGDVNKLSQIVSVFKKIVWFTGLLGALITLIFSKWLSKITFGDYSYTWSFVMLSITLLLNQLTVGQNVILQGMRKIKYLASANIIGSLLSLIITIPLYYIYGLDGIVPALILLSFSTFIVASFYSSKVKVSIYNPSFEEIKDKGKDMIKLGFFISISGMIMTFTSYLLRLYISNEGGVEDVGLYNAGFKIIGTYVGLVFTAMSTDYFPRLSAIADDKFKLREIVNHQSEIAILIIGPLMVLFISFSDFFLTLLYSKKFLPINIMLVWSSLGVIFKAASWPIGYIFLAKGENKIFFYSELAGNVYTLIFNVLGYKYFGLTGLGLSYLCSFLLVYIQVGIISYFRYGFVQSKGFFKNLFIFCLFLISVLFLIFFNVDNDFYILRISIVLMVILYSILSLRKKVFG